MRVLGNQGRDHGEVPCGFLVLRPAVSKEALPRRKRRSCGLCATSWAGAGVQACDHCGAAAETRSEKSCAAPKKIADGVDLDDARRQSRIPRCWTNRRRAEGERVIFVTFLNRPYFLNLILMIAHLRASRRNVRRFVPTGSRDRQAGLLT